MKVIVGLGNPGSRYERTRHNLGFWVIDRLAERWAVPLTRHKFNGKYGEGMAHGEKVVLVKPQTFMNRSGETVGPLVNYFQLDLENLLVVYDDMALASGMIRVRGQGSAGGHNGVANIIHHLGRTDFPRLRIGIGQPPPHLDSADYVLQGIGGPELIILEEAALSGADAVELWIKDGLNSVMNHFNRKQTNEDK